MFKHLLAPLDGSSLAEVVLPEAQAFAERLQARITLLHITEKNPPTTVHGERHLTNTPDAEAYLRSLVQTLSLTSPSTITAHVHGADSRGVAQMIVDQADELRADLIVLSTHGSSGLRESVLGSIAQQVVHEGRTPVLLVRPRKDGATIAPQVSHIVLPLDGDGVHENAIPVAVALARAWGATIHLVNVVPTLETLHGHESASGAVLPNAMRAVLDLAEQGGADYLQRIRANMDVPTTALVVRGDPAKCIVNQATKVRADLIVMATHGRMGLDAFWAASVAPKVLRALVGPLLLLRAKEK